MTGLNIGPTFLTSLRNDSALDPHSKGAIEGVVKGICLRTGVGLGARLPSNKSVHGSAHGSVLTLSRETLLSLIALAAVLSFSLQSQAQVVARSIALNAATIESSQEWFQAVPQSEPTLGQQVNSPQLVQPEFANTVRLTPEQKANHKRVYFMWNIGLSGESFQNQTEHSQIVGLGLNGDLRINLSDSMLLHVKAGAALQSGYAQSDFGDTVPHNGLALSEAIIQYHPWTPLYFQAGAIDESFVGSPYLPGGAFPGALQKIAIGSNKLGVDLIGQETIPTSTTLATDTVNKEPTPFYTTQGLTFKWQPYNVWQLKATVLHYRFENLPSLTAFDSLSYGNTILNIGPNSSAYAYQFNGWMAGGDSKVKIMRDFSWTIGSHVLDNTDAPSSYNMAQWVETGFEIGLPADIDFIPKVASFFAESDVAPGFYNSSDIGHNNRQGFSVSTDFVFKKEKFKVGATYSDANVIDENAYQTHQQYIQLRFESLYDLI